MPGDSSSSLCTGCFGLLAVFPILVGPAPFLEGRNVRCSRMEYAEKCSHEKKLFWRCSKRLDDRSVR
jgi:hypothetical protein